jgi:hypothetical protein
MFGVFVNFRTVVTSLRHIELILFIKRVST